MSDKLKKFVTDHKQEFESSEPAKDLWTRIDAKLDVKDPSRISSNWLWKFKYIWLSASILVIAIYLVESNLNETSANPSNLDKKDPAVNTPIKNQTSVQNVAAVSENNGSENGERTKKSGMGNLKAAAANNSDGSKHDTLKIKRDPIQIAGSIETNEMEDHHSDSLEETTSNSVKPTAGKKVKFTVPVEPEDINVYTGTLYNGSNFCNMLRAYKFPGKVGLDMGSRKTSNNYKIIMTTTSCSRLARVPNMKAIWLKGKTSKKIMFSLKDGFKNIQLVKKDGKTVTPEAVSHYYPGLLVISNYNGKFFNMAFEDKVDLILFFKDAEEGDKVVIDGSIEALVKDQQ